MLFNISQRYSMSCDKPERHCKATYMLNQAVILIALISWKGTIKECSVTNKKKSCVSLFSIGFIQLAVCFTYTLLSKQDGSYIKGEGTSKIVSLFETFTSLFICMSSYIFVRRTYSMCLYYVFFPVDFLYGIVPSHSYRCHACNFHKMT